MLSCRIFNRIKLKRIMSKMRAARLVEIGRMDCEEIEMGPLELRKCKSSDGDGFDLRKRSSPRDDGGFDGS